MKVTSLPIHLATIIILLTYPVTAQDAIQPLKPRVQTGKNVKPVATTLDIAAAQQQLSVASMVEPNPTHVLIEKKLKEKISVDFNKTPLKDVIKFLATNLQINVIFHQPSVADTGIEPDTPVTFKVTSITLESLLNLILKPLDLSYIVNKEALVIISEDRAEDFYTTVVYDIRKLTTAGFSEKDIMSVISKSTDASWEGDENQNSGGIIFIPGGCVIWDTHHVHEQIFDLLQQLERMIDQTHLKSKPDKQLQPELKPLNFAAAQKEPPVAIITKPSKEAQKIEKELEKLITVNFKETKLKDVVKFLAKQHQLNIILDPRGIAESEIDTEEPLSLTQKNMKLKNVLKLLLEPIGLAYFVKEDVLIITTQIINDQEYTSLLYDVRKLYAAGIDSKLLKKIITNATDTLWESGGEGSGTIKPLAGCLLISQTIDGQKEILPLLQQLERLIDRKKTKQTNIKVKYN